MNSDHVINSCPIHTAYLKYWNDQKNWRRQLPTAKICKVYTYEWSILQVFMCEVWRMRRHMKMLEMFWNRELRMNCGSYSDVSWCRCVWRHSDASLLPSPVFSHVLATIACPLQHSLKQNKTKQKDNNNNKNKTHSFKESCGQKCALGVCVRKSPESAHFLPDWSLTVH